MRRPKRRSVRLSVEAMDRRILPTGLTGVWVGQDGHDLVGQSTTPGPDGVRDIHIQLTGVPADRQIVFADVQGLGGGDWQFQGSFGPWAAAMVRDPNSPTADFYIEPYQTETGRPFSISLNYDDGSTDSVWFAGGTADPNLRMPSAALTVDSAGLNGHDLVGLGPDVGPDGFQDLDFRLSGISPNVAIQSLTVSTTGGSSWVFGSNPTGLNNAELVLDANDASKGDLYIQPAADLQGQTVTLSLSYANGKSDSTTHLVSSATPPDSPMPAPPALLTLRSGVTASWLGQDGLDLTGPGDAHVAVANLPADRTVVAATLNDPSGGLWAFASSSAGSYYIDPYTPLLGFQADAPNGADLTFQPSRDELGQNLTLRLQFDDGSMALVPIVGDSIDLGLRGAEPSSTVVTAQPGDDLNSLANQYGTVELSPGVYTLDQPLVLNHPVTITSTAPGATLLFSQPPNAPAWTTAILVQASHVALDGFAVRFAGPINWNQDVQFGPAVIGSTNNLDPSPGGDPLVALSFTWLDLRSPAAATSWEAAPSLFRLDTATSGSIANNTLQGGTTEVANGPWRIVDNNYLGTVANTYTSTAFASHHGHDLVLEGNHLEPAAQSGKTYRFLVMNQGGVDDTIASNTVIGVGPMDGDVQPSNNSAEVLLTENYALHFEGMPSAISPDGMFLQIPTPAGGAARAGDVVAILSGPNAGEWRQIAQGIDPQTYVMSSPLPAGRYAISILNGFVRETFTGNTIDTTGSSTTVDMDLQGGHFGAQITDNTLIGGAVGLLVSSPPSNVPSTFGWSHTPFLGASIDGNIVRDSIGSVGIFVAHGDAIKSSVGREYLSGSLDNTTIQWTDAFLAAHPDPVALTIGDLTALDPGEINLSIAGNAIQTNPAQPIDQSAFVNNAVINGSPMTAAVLSLPRRVPSAVAGLGLVVDTGHSASDGITNDGRARFQTDPGAAGYEYRVGSIGAFQPVASPTGFTPAGLSQGSNDVWVRAIDAFGNRGPAVSFTFVLDTIAPVDAPPALAPGADTGRFSNDGITNVSSPAFVVAGAPTDAVELERNGVVAATRTGAGPIADPGSPSDGAYSYQVRRTDVAGNVSLSSPFVVALDRTPPSSAPPVLAPGFDSGGSATDDLTNVLSPSFVVTGDLNDAVALVRNGVVVASRTGPGLLADPGSPADGVYSYQLDLTDLAGNHSLSSSLLVTLDRTPPAAGSPILAQGSDSGRSPTDGVTNVSSPSFIVSGDATDAIVLYRDGFAAAGRIGPGTLTDSSALGDGTYFYSLFRLDRAGNASMSGAYVVTIDRAPPPAVLGLTAVASSTIQFTPGELGDAFEYRLTASGPYIAFGSSTTFNPAGVRPGLNLIWVRAVDLAGNIGPAASLVFNTAAQVPSGVWLGQDGPDLVGPTSRPVPDGVRDVHIALAGLRKGRAIASIDVRGAGGGEWMYHGPVNGPPAAALVRSLNSTTGDLYFNPTIVETGRVFTIQIVYANRQRDSFTVMGGIADPTHRSSVAARANSSTSRAPVNPTGATHRRQTT
jgi:Bacterial Ig-like domain